AVTEGLSPTGAGSRRNFPVCPCSESCLTLRKSCAVRRSQREKSRGVDNGGRELGDCSRPSLNSIWGLGGSGLGGESRFPGREGVLRRSVESPGRAQATRGSGDGGEEFQQHTDQPEVERQWPERPAGGEILEAQGERQVAACARIVQPRDGRAGRNGRDHHPS